MDHALTPTPPFWLRILQHPLTRLVILGCTLFYLMAWTEEHIQDFKDSPQTGIAIAIAMGLVAIGLYVAWGKFIERRTVSEFSSPGAGREFALGALLGVGLYTGCVLLLMLVGMYKVEGFNPVAYMVPAIAMAVKSSVFEELVFRGVLYRSVEDMAGSWIAIVISSLAFGFIHLLNPAATIVSAIYISVEAGLLFSAAYLLTQRLWIAIGFHLLWNYVQSAVYSGVVSGDVALPGLLKARIEGPSFVTGGTFGMEQSVFAFILCTGAGAVMLLIAKRRGHLRPAPWNRGG